MPLIYGLPQNHPYWSHVWNETLDEGQKAWFHRHPFMGGIGGLLMVWDIGHISPDTIEEIIVREMYISPSPLYPKLREGNMKENEEELRNALRPFIGFEANVCTMTRNEWIKKQQRNLREIPEFKSSKSIEMEWKKFDKYKKELCAEWEKDNPFPECCGEKMKYKRQGDIDDEDKKYGFSCIHCGKWMDESDHYTWTPPPEPQKEEEESNGNNDTPQDGTETDKTE